MILHLRGPSDVGWPLPGSNKADPCLNRTQPQHVCRPAIWTQGCHTHITTASGCYYTWNSWHPLTHPFVFCCVLSFSFFMWCLFVSDSFSVLWVLYFLLLCLFSVVSPVNVSLLYFMPRWWSHLFSQLGMWREPYKVSPHTILLICY